MMKKFLVMLTVLAAISNAAIVELSLNGATNVPHADMATTMIPSDYFELDVQVTADPLNKLNWDVTVGAGAPGSFTLGNISTPPAPNAYLIDYSASYGYSYASFLNVADASVGGLGTYWTSVFHCDGPGMVVISLLDTGGNVMDTITVSQIPEPMTVALLGLGGLFLRRRK